MIREADTFIVNCQLLTVNLSKEDNLCLTKK